MQFHYLQRMPLSCVSAEACLTGWPNARTPAHIIEMLRWTAAVQLEDTPLRQTDQLPTSFMDMRPRNMAATVRYLPCRGSQAAIMFLASNICWTSSGTVSARYCWLPRDVSGAKPGMKKCRRGNGTMLTASLRRSAFSCQTHNNLTVSHRHHNNVGFCLICLFSSASSPRLTWIKGW